MIRQHQNLKVLLQEDLEGRSLLHGLDGVTRHVVDALLALLHSVQVLVQTHLLTFRLGGVESQELGQLGAVGVILIATHLQVLVELLPELCPQAFLVLLLLLFFLFFLLFAFFLLVISARLFVLSQLLHQLQDLSHKLLGNDLHDLVLLQLLAGHVQGQIVGVHDATHKVQVPRQELIKLLRHQDSADKEFHLRLLGPVVVHHVKWSLLGQEQN
mmetsp:Transcript_55953/g.68463  ORF Transcript_55953/g.68463 Transcript_55953/m.68463 type:complete len:214 (-) Transcript_55953:157-798(-)